VLNNTASPFRQLLLNRFVPPDERDHVHAVVRLKQREVLVVVESVVKVSGLDLGVKAIEDTEELGKDAASGTPPQRRRYRQRVALFLYTGVEYGGTQ